MRTPPRLGLPNLGLGVGLRSAHLTYLVEHRPDVEWLEIISENFLDGQGRPRYLLDELAEHYPVVMHGVSLSVGGTDPLDVTYLDKLKRLADQVGARWVSDHVCWTGVTGLNTHELLPLPLTEAALGHVVRRIRVVQDVLGRPLVLENPATYLSYAGAEMPEWEFLGRMAEDAGCGLLLDLNNVHVSGTNHGFDPVAYIRALPAERVVQLHLAGHTDVGTHLVDSHDTPVSPSVWELYRVAVEHFGDVPALLEWDDRIPPFPVLQAEVLKARTWMRTPPTGPPADHPAPPPADAEPPDLRRLQVSVQSMILGSDGPVATTGADGTARENRRADTAAEAIVASSTTLTSAQRVGLYRYGHSARTLRCLRGAYPALRHTLGDELFDAFAADYVQRHPSRSYTLAELGRGFARHLEASRPDTDGARESWPDLIVDIARVERALQEVYDGPGVEGAPVLAGEDLPVRLDDSWRRATLQPVPCLRLLATRVPLADYVSAVRRGQRPELPTPRRAYTVVIRRDFVVRLREVDEQEATALRALVRGADVERAAEEAALTPGEVWSQVRGWADAGFFRAARERARSPL